jgi:hypothetical protein
MTDAVGHPTPARLRRIYILARSSAVANAIAVASRISAAVFVAHRG